MPSMKCHLEVPTIRNDFLLIASIAARVEQSRKLMDRSNNLWILQYHSEATPIRGACDCLGIPKSAV
jgi:hypothetical protein